MSEQLPASARGADRGLHDPATMRTAMRCAAAVLIVLVAAAIYCLERDLDPGPLLKYLGPGALAAALVTLANGGGLVALLPRLGRMERALAATAGTRATEDPGAPQEPAQPPQQPEQPARPVTPLQPVVEPLEPPLVTTSEEVAESDRAAAPPPYSPSERVVLARALTPPEPIPAQAPADDPQTEMIPVVRVSGRRAAH